MRYLHWSASQAPFPEQEEGVFNFTYVRAHVRVGSEASRMAQPIPPDSAPVLASLDAAPRPQLGSPLFQDSGSLGSA